MTSENRLKQIIDRLHDQEFKMICALRFLNLINLCNLSRHSELRKREEKKLADAASMIEHLRAELYRYG
ncbi:MULTISPECIES: hypothetical protein [Thalassospira]|nr:MULTISPECIES: hypothetical protein [Thalassospira]MDG4720865.1 hypothetical protein [Thalassospira sp. FZY0004]